MLEAYQRLRWIPKKHTILIHNQKMIKNFDPTGHKIRYPQIKVRYATTKGKRTQGIDAHGKESNPKNAVNSDILPNNSIVIL